MKADHASPSSPQPRRDALDWPRISGQAEEFMTLIAERERRRRQRRLQGAGALLLVAGLAFFGWRSQHPTAPAMPAAATPVLVTTSAPSHQVLPDGSFVDLKAGAEFATDFTPEMRRVILRRGEAHFQVTKNPARPFVVEASGITVRAVGTAFSVNSSPSSIEVLVTEGRVAVAEQPVAIPAAVAADTPLLATLDVGKGVVVDVAPADGSPRVQHTRLFDLSAPQIDERLAWRTPQLDLNNTPLAQVLSKINRYTPIPLMLADAELGRVELSGTLRADNVDALLRVLENNYGIHAERLGGKIVLRKVP